MCVSLFALSHVSSTACCIVASWIFSELNFLNLVFSTVLNTDDDEDDNDNESDGGRENDRIRRGQM